MTGISDATVAGITVEGKGGERLVIASVKGEMDEYTYGIFMLDAVGNAAQVGVLFTKGDYARVYDFLEPMRTEDDDSDYGEEEM